MATHTAFSTAHPAVPALYAGVTLGLTMFTLHPALAGISLAGAFAYGCVAEGPARTVEGLRWQLPLVLLVALVNPLFVRRGSTVLLSVLGRPVYLESLAFGATMAVVLLATVLWFRAIGHMLSYDKVLDLTGSRLPVLGLMISMVMRLVPRLVRRGHQIASVQDVAFAGVAPSLEGGARRQALKRRLRQSSVLMGWAMEDSLETADAMRARGWASTRARTTYARYKMRSWDRVALVLLGLGAAGTAWFAWGAVSGFSFYPVMSQAAAPGLAFVAGIAAYAAWMFLPSFLHVYEERSFA